MKNKNIYIILINLVILLPLLFITKLPNDLIVHWNINGIANYTISKSGYSGFVLGMFIANSYISYKTRNIKFSYLCLIIVPILSLTIFFINLAYVFGYKVDIVNTIIRILAILQIISFNYLPKIEQNKFLGIKTKWTLNDKEIWLKTHRLQSKMGVYGSILLLILTLFKATYIRNIIIIIVLVFSLIMPFIYSIFLGVNKRLDK